MRGLLKLLPVKWGRKTCLLIASLLKLPLPYMQLSQSYPLNGTGFFDSILESVADSHPIQLT